MSGCEKKVLMLDSDPESLKGAVRMKKQNNEDLLSGMGEGARIAAETSDTKRHEGLIADIFRGKPEFSHVFPWLAKPSAAATAGFEETKKDFEGFLKTVDTEEIEKTGDIDPAVIEEMSRRGYFALKLGAGYGGRGLSHSAYSKFVGLVASKNSGLAILVSADNTIGVKYAVMNYGTPEQKAKYLPDLSKKPSGFCFTEEKVGSDPSKMETYALRVRNKNGWLAGYELNGWKWYTTNPQLAEYLAVVAKIVDSPDETQKTKCFGLFIVPTKRSGVEIGPRNTFWGMSGIYNGNPRFKNVFMKADELVGGEGLGFRIAQESLNYGRLAIAAGCVAASKQAFLASRWYAAKRVQWGKPIGAHQAIGSGMLAPAAANLYAMNAMLEYSLWLADSEKDIRLQAAASKVFTSELGWKIIDDTIQIFGGRGYQNFESLSRIEKTAPAGRIFRDFRPNRIFEGSTQILAQWLNWQGMIEFTKASEDFKRSGLLEKISIAKRFAPVFAKSLFGREVPGCAPKAMEEHLGFFEENVRRLLWANLRLYGRHGKKLRGEQLLLLRTSWIVYYLAAIAITCSKATEDSKSLGDEPVELAHLFSLMAEGEIRRLFRELDENLDDEKDLVAEQVARKKYRFLEEGIVPCVDYDNL